MSDWLFIAQAVFAFFAPIYCVWRWNALGIIAGTAAFWVIVGLPAAFGPPSLGKLMFILAVPMGACYSVFAWIVLLAGREVERLFREGVRSYRRHTAQGLSGWLRLASVWRDVNRRKPNYPVL